MVRYLIFGNGWLGNKLQKDLPEAVLSLADITSRQAVHNAIEQHKPSFVINAAGKTGKPNIDWCEDHITETFASNVKGPIMLRDVCLEQKVNLVHIGSGCIYDGDNGGMGYSEEDEPNYSGSFYSRTKIWAEKALKGYNVLQLRLRMPVDKEPSERNLITKLTKYQRIIDIPNSMTVIDDFLYATKTLMEKECRGIYNITNQGALGHARILELYREIVDPSFQFSIMSMKELLTITKAGRSNCILNTEKLQKEGIILPPIEEAMKRCLREYRRNH